MWATHKAQKHCTLVQVGYLEVPFWIYENGVVVQYRPK